MPAVPSSAYRAPEPPPHLPADTRPFCLLLAVPMCRPLPPQQSHSCTTYRSCAMTLLVCGLPPPSSQRVVSQPQAICVCSKLLHAQVQLSHSPPPLTAHLPTPRADAFRNAPVSSPRDIEDCLLEWLCYCQAHFSESIGGTLPSLLANDDLLLDCAGQFPRSAARSFCPSPPLPPSSSSLFRRHRDLLRPCCSCAVDQAHAQAHAHAA